MSKPSDNFMVTLMIIALLVITAISFAGCASTPPVEIFPRVSMDQATLKAGDTGCPTAIYTAPSGILTQCPPEVTQGETGTTTYFPGGVDPAVALAAVGAEKPVNRGYPTIEAAAIAGLQSIAAKPTSSYYEWGGNLAVDPKTGQYFYHEANTSYGGDHVRIDDDEFSLLDDVGAYHTHPCVPEHDVEYFSPADMMDSIFEHKFAFMGDFCTGNVHEFKPGDKPDVEHAARPDGKGFSPLYLTKGRIIGKFADPRPMLEVK